MEHISSLLTMATSFIFNTTGNEIHCFHCVKISRARENAEVEGFDFSG
jgi:hypothetical protein